MSIAPTKTILSRGILNGVVAMSRISVAGSAPMCWMISCFIWALFYLSINMLLLKIAREIHGGTPGKLPPEPDPTAQSARLRGTARFSMMHGNDGPKVYRITDRS